MLLTLIIDAWRFLVQCFRLALASALAAENLFLRKQLALYEERQVHPRQATNATRLAMVWLSHWFDWRSALRVVKPETFTRWHREGFHLFWRWKSKPGRSALPKDFQALIHRIALDNLSWGPGAHCLCRAIAWEIQEHDVNLNTGLPLSVIMPKAS